ncbi:unnamed protein product [Parajaminaea phylloscopi]
MVEWSRWMVEKNPLCPGPFFFSSAPGPDHPGPSARDARATFDERSRSVGQSSLYARASWISVVSVSTLGNCTLRPRAVMAFEYVRSASPVRSLSSSSSSSSSSSGGSTELSRSEDGGGPSPLSLVPSVLPDLRFEQSYLASVRAFIHELTPQQAEAQKERVISEKEGAKGSDGEEDIGRRAPWIVTGHSEDASASDPSISKPRPSWHHGEPELWIGRLRVDWLPLVTVTIRDQIFSPLFQGALWGVIGLFLGHARGIAASQISAQAAAMAAWMRSPRRNRF